MENKYQITTIGRIFYQVMELLESTLERAEFFNAHSLDLPLQLILQIGSFKTAEIGSQTMQNVQAWAEIVKNSERFIYAISEQFQDSIIPIIEKKIKHQELKIKTIIERNILQNSVKVGQKLKDRHFFYDKIRAFENVRVIDDNDLSLIASDKGAILFLKKEGKIDYSQCLKGDSKAFIDWSCQIFNWYWKKGKSLEQYVRK